MKVRQVFDPIVVGVVVIFFVAIANRLLLPIGVSIVSIEGYVSNPATVVFLLLFAFVVGWIAIFVSRMIAKQRHYIVKV